MTQESLPLPDIQKTRDVRGVPLERVGVTGIKMPIRLLRRPPLVRDESFEDTHCDTVAKFEMSVHLPAHVKGTHMSRFTEVLQEHIDVFGVLSHEHLQSIACTLVERLDASQATIRMVCDYFVLQPAPVSRKRGVAPLKGVLEVTAAWHVVDRDRGIARVISCGTGIEIDGKTCCPCSREISDFDPETGKGKGAHAQRSHIQIMTTHGPQVMIWFEDLVKVCQEAFSSPVYPVLKRPDERAVTVGAYENPKFVEDVTRDVVMGLRCLNLPFTFKVRVQNAESIHYHDAFAESSG